MAQEWRMSRMCGKDPHLVMIALLCMLHANLALAQRNLPPQGVPANFTADVAFAARVRAVLLPYAKPATGRYAVGQEVLRKLLQQLPADTARFSWDLRIARNAGNVFSSPDGTIFVDEGLAQILGTHSGLWA